jgi:hypothetical protein
MEKLLMKKIFTIILFSLIVIPFADVLAAQESVVAGTAAGTTERAEAVAESATEQKTVKLDPVVKNSKTDVVNGEEAEKTAKQEKKNAHAAKNSVKSDKKGIKIVAGQKNGCPTGMPGVEIRVYTLKNGVYINAWGTNPLASALLQQMAEEYLPPEKTAHHVRNIRYSDDIVSTVKKCFGGDISSAVMEWNYENALEGTLTGSEKKTVSQIHIAADGWRKAVSGN